MTTGVNTNGNGTMGGIFPGEWPTSDDGTLYGSTKPEKKSEAKEIEDATAVPREEVADQVELDPIKDGIDELNRKKSEQQRRMREFITRQKLKAAIEAAKKDDRRWHALGGNRAVREALDTNGMGSTFRSTADALGLWGDIQIKLAEVFEESIERTFRRIGPVRGSQVSPQLLGELLRDAGIRDFDRTKTVAELFRDMIAPAPGCHETNDSTGVSDFLRDPNLSLEEKLMLLMAKLSEDLDKEIEEKMEKLDKMTTGKVNGSDTGIADDGSSKQTLQTELQLLMERRQELFQTTQNMLKSLHDTSMSAIRNFKA